MSKLLTHVYAIRALIFGVLIPATFIAGFKLGTYYATERDIDYVGIYGHRMDERTKKLLELEKWYENLPTTSECLVTEPLSDQR